MYSKISKLLLILVFVSIVSYLFYFNPQEVVVHFGNESSITSPLALTLITCFFLGVLLTTLIAVFLGVKLQLEKWRIKKKLDAQDSHYQDLAKVKDLLAIADTAGARGLLTKIINKDSTDILARLSLSKSYRLEGNTEEAIKVLESARATEKRSPALLLELANTYDLHGNKTAALDNILLCLRENPKSAVILERAIDLAKQMGRLDEAESYALDLLKYCPYSEQNRIQNLLAATKLEKIRSLKATQPEEYRSQLNSLIKTHKEFEQAQLELADDLFTLNDPNQAVKILQKIVKKGESREALSKLVSFWVSTNNPSAAISLLREMISQGEPKLQLHARTLLTQLLLKLENIDEAEIELKALEELIPLGSNERSIVEILKAKHEARVPGRGKSNTSLEKLLHSESEKIGLPSLSKTSLH